MNEASIITPPPLRSASYQAFRDIIDGITDERFIQGHLSDLKEMHDNKSSWIARWEITNAPGMLLFLVAPKEPGKELSCTLAAASPKNYGPGYAHYSHDLLPTFGDGLTTQTDYGMALCYDLFDTLRDAGLLSPSARMARKGYGIRSTHPPDVAGYIKLTAESVNSSRTGFSKPVILSDGVPGVLKRLGADAAGGAAPGAEQPAP